MTKKLQGKEPRQLTRRQLSSWERQKRRQRIILFTGILTIAAVVAILFSGWYTNAYRPLHETVITVNGAKFDMQYFINTIKLVAKNNSQYNNSGDEAVKDIEQNALIIEQSPRLGITVSDNDVKKKLDSLGLVNNAATWDAVKAQLLAEKVRDEYLAPKQIPETIAQVHIQVMLLESEQQANAVRARLDKGESFADLSAQLSLNPVIQQKKGNLGWHPQDILAAMVGSKVPGDYAFGSEAGTLSQPRNDEDVPKQLGYWLVKLVKRNETIADVNIILLSSEQQAKEIRARIAAGEDFATLAKQYSQISSAKDDGGNPGPINKGTLSTAFDDFVFNPDTKEGTLSEPIRDATMVTRGGSWLIKVLEKSDARPLDDSDKQGLKTKALNDWVTSIWANPDNKIDDSYLDAVKKSWAQLRASNS
ncbi:MAG: peptidylprolyl isomerase [Dehalococcoidales bacterium]|nr:peptidylprolyl isomerase [Dehalococcoidales bacterium]